MTRTAKTPAAPAALAPVDIELPLWPAAVTARRRWEAFRGVVGRLATLAGATAAAAGLFTPDLMGPALLADAVLTLGGLASLRLWKPDGQQKVVASVLYAGPGVSLAALLIAEQMLPGIHPAEAGALAAWTAGTWVLRPAGVARTMLTRPRPAAAPVEPATVAQVVCDHPAARWWAQHAAGDGGAAPDTVLDDVQRTGERSIRAVIRATVAGQPVPDIPIRRLSALMDVPEDEIAIDPVPGRGAGVRRLTVGAPEEDAEDLSTVWTKTIAPAAMPGAVLTGVRVGDPAAGGPVTTIPATTEEDA
ncbi:hypothetical protein [Nonomuraea typhae]|uniref:Uncharacterized protein n=1 Tax=Nonomuraea typhae TaxID=2603600 RepID=A0ABW7YTX2_9ACTN